MGLTISVFVHSFFPSIGGIQTLAYNLAKGLACRGHKVTIFTTLKRGIRKEDVIDGIKVYRYPRHLKMISRPWYITPGMIRAIRCRELFESDLVHGYNSISFAALFSLFAGKLMRKAVALTPTLHERALSYRELAAHQTLRHCDLLFALSQQEKKLLSRYVDEGKITMIPPGISSGLFKAWTDRSVFREEHGLKGDHKLVLYVGAFSGHKRVADVVRNFPHVLRSLPDARLLLVGGGFKEAELRRMVRSMSLDEQVLFLGRMREEQLVKAYMSVDAFILPSAHESFGIVLLEAAAAGLPIVTTRVGVAEEVVADRANGRIVALRDFPSAIVEVLKNDVFKEEAMRRRPRVIQNYDWQNITLLVERAYQTLLKG